jgi:hypothetical protein
MDARDSHIGSVGESCEPEIRDFENRYFEQGVHFICDHDVASSEIAVDDASAVDVRNARRYHVSEPECPSTPHERGEERVSTRDEWVR